MDDQLLTRFYSDKVRALLSYLALEGRPPVRREVLAELLWPGYLPKSARASLRVALSQLRKRLSPLDLLIVTRQTVGFDVSHPDFWCDVTTFEALLEAGDCHPHPDLARCRTCRETLQEAVALYVEGSPLGIEWAAALVERRPCAEIAGALQQSLDTLATSMRDLPARVFLTCYRILQANPDPRAGEILQTAYELLQARAAQIQDVEMRQTFLENVKAHPEIVAAWQAAQA